MSTNNCARPRYHFPRVRRHSFNAFGAFILACLMMVGLAEGAPSGNAVVLLTADGEGHVNSCESCPANHGMGGLARRATVVARAKAESPVLLLDAGNWLAGEQSLSSRGEVIATAYDAMGYDAVNITPKDLYWGKAQTLALVGRAKFAAVSANLIDAETGSPIVLPYVVKSIQGHKVAILGVSETPPGLASLPHLQSQLAGIRIRPVIDALEEWLPKARKDAESVVILYQGNGAGLRSLRAKMKGTGVIIGVSGVRPENAPKEGDPPVVAAERHGQTVASRLITADESQVTQLAVTPDVVADATLAEVTTRFAMPPIQSVALATAAMPATTRAILFTGPRIAALQPRQPRGLAGVGLTDQEVTAAIHRGAVFLWKAVKTERFQFPNGKLGDGGEFDVLYSLALVKAGYHREDPEFDDQLRSFLAAVRPDQLGTYACSALCVLIDDYGDPAFQPKLRQAARCLLEGQGRRGSWDYNLRVPPEALLDPTSLKPVQVWGGVPPEGSHARAERWGRLSPIGDDHNGDNSLTQYAVLGLHAASHSGVEVPQDVWKRIYELYRERQAADGGWGYVEPTQTRTGSMTCAGIFAASLSKFHAGDQNAATDEVVERGLGWLAGHFSAVDNPASQGTWVYYYLYALERAARTLGTEFIGEYEWYPLGAKFLLSRQQEDGGWPMSTGEGRSEVSTSFALLFLNRGTVTMGTARPHGGKGTLKTALVEPPAPRVYLILDCSGSMLEEMGHKTKFDAARDAVLNIIEALPAKTQIALRAYGHHKRAVETGANEDTELLLPMAEPQPGALANALGRLRARGLTPMALSLRNAAKDLAGAGTGDIAVILLTDGGEDTLPRQDPVAAAGELALVKNVSLQIVGFDIGRDDWGQQLKAMAAAGHGRYWPATNPGELQREMRAAVLRAPDGFTITDASGREVATRTFGQSISLPEGSYQFATSFAGKAFQEPFWINTESTTAVLFDAGKIDFTPPPGPASAAPTTAGMAKTEPDAKSSPSPVAPAMARFCSECGKPLPANAKFCPNCGKVVGK
jgi:hypothetical protein